MRKGNETGRACEAEPVAAAVLRVLNEIAGHLGLHANIAGKHCAVAAQHMTLGNQNIDAQNDALVADEGALARANQLAHLVLRLPAEVAVDRVRHSRFTPKSAAMWTPKIRTVTISAMVLVPSHMAYAACDWRAVRSTPHFFASLRMAGMRQSGILPVLENFQLDTVDGVRFSAVATLEVPPSASMMAAAFCIPHYYGIRNSFARA